MTLFGHKYVETFNQLIDQIVHPIYLKRFSKKHAFLQNNTVSLDTEVENIRTEEQCFNIGPDCRGAFHGLNDALNKFFRTFTVLKKYFKTDKDSPKSFEIRNHGTLLANLNFLLESDRTKDETMSVVNSQLELDLTKLLNNIIPSPNVPLDEYLGLLGYCNGLDCEVPTSKIEIANVISKNCSFSNESNRSKCENSKLITKLHRPDRTKSAQKASMSCDNRMLKQHWDRYMESLGTFIEVGPMRNNLDTPCTGKKRDDESDDQPEIEGCCILYDHFFSRKNTKKILTLMKYSLDITNPWITGHQNIDDGIEGSANGPWQKYVIDQLRQVMSDDNKLQQFDGWR